MVSKVTKQDREIRKRLTARFMRQDNFTFTPKFQLIIVGNHQSKL